METLVQKVKNQYYKHNLFEEILNRLKETGVDLENITRNYISGVDEFHVRGAAVSKELAEMIDISGKRLLDIGCGLGGACRMLADEFNCRVTGIDISQEFIRTAKKLSELLTLNEPPEFLQADASADLPFADNSFDVVWTQHVQMNIPGKVTFYTEIYRVLAKGGHFMYYDIFKKNNGKIDYPMPWANTHDISFLFTPFEMESILNYLKFRNIQSTDQSKAGINFFEGLIKRFDESGPSKLGLNVLMGDSAKSKFVNLLNGLKSGTLMLQSGVFEK